jgi:hypothetical protein
MTLLSMFPMITRFDFWFTVGLALFVWFALKACNFHIPGPEVVQGYATLANTKGGLVLLMTAMWFFTLIGTASIAIWVLVKGLDPQNGVLITLFGMFISQAFGTVNGALFKTMTGEDPKPPGTVSTKSETVSSVVPARVVEAVTDLAPPAVPEQKSTDAPTA